MSNERKLHLIYIDRAIEFEYGADGSIDQHYRFYSPHESRLNILAARILALRKNFLA